MNNDIDIINHLAVLLRSGRTQEFIELLNHNPEIQHLNRASAHILRVALNSQFGNYALFHTLIQHGADPNKSYDAGFCALSLFLWYFNSIIKHPSAELTHNVNQIACELVGLIDERHINFQDSNGQTALHEAAKAGLVHVVSKLLEKGADPMLINSKNKSALWYASSFANRYDFTEHADINYDAIVTLLIERGANLETTDRTHHSSSYKKSLAHSHSIPLTFIEQEVKPLEEGHEFELQTVEILKERLNRGEEIPNLDRIIPDLIPYDFDTYGSASQEQRVNSCVEMIALILERDLLNNTTPFLKRYKEYSYSEDITVLSRLIEKGYAQAALKLLEIGIPIQPEEYAGIIRKCLETQNITLLSAILGRIKHGTHTQPELKAQIISLEDLIRADNQSSARIDALIIALKENPCIQALMRPVPKAPRIFPKG